MINLAEQDLESHLIRRVADLERQMRELKAAVQPIGGDTLEVIPSSGSLVGPIALAPNSFVLISVRCYVPGGGRTLWDNASTVYVDALDSQHAWPNLISGAGVLTPEQQNLDVRVWLDYEHTDFTTGDHMYRTYILNNDTVSHNIWHRGRSFLPKQDFGA